MKYETIEDFYLVLIVNIIFYSMYYITEMMKIKISTYD